MQHISIYTGDCRAILKKLDANSMGACITDPPYEIGMMGQHWDTTRVAFDLAVWLEVFRVLKPGGVVMAFAASRNAHRVADALEKAGFINLKPEIWCYGSGMSHGKNVAKAIDKSLGHEVKGNDWVPTSEEAKKWLGYYTTLKPAQEPILVGYKPE